MGGGKETGVYVGHRGKLTNRESRISSWGIYGSTGREGEKFIATSEEGEQRRPYLLVGG